MDLYTVRRTVDLAAPAWLKRFLLLGLWVLFGLGCDSQDAPIGPGEYRASVHVLRSDGSTERAVAWEGQAVLLSSATAEHPCPLFLVYFTGVETAQHGHIILSGKDPASAPTSCPPAETPSVGVHTLGQSSPLEALLLSSQAGCPVDDLACSDGFWSYTAESGTLKVERSEGVFSGRLDFVAALEQGKGAYGERVRVELTFIAAEAGYEASARSD